MKLLIVNSERPHESHYCKVQNLTHSLSPKELVNKKLQARDYSNYKLFLVSKSGKMEPVKLHEDLEKTKQNAVTLMRYYSKLEEK